ncbi:MAG: nitroreductase family protein, partial [Anaerolineae bacterium]
VRRSAGSDRRLPWDRLFFRNSFDTPLTQDEAGAYAVPLEMVRLGPSASNKQPWRVVKMGGSWHFYLSRTKGYGQGRLTRAWTNADMQRLDMGIALCHFEQTAREMVLEGRWVVDPPDLGELNELTEYTVSWAA